jgi:hypothetical protein
MVFCSRHLIKFLGEIYAKNNEVFRQGIEKIDEWCINADNEYIHIDEMTSEIEVGEV